MNLRVKLLKGGREESVEVKDDSITVHELKQVLEEVFDVPVEEQSLVFRGKALLDSQSLDHYGLTDGVKIFLTHRPPATSTPVTASSVSADSSRPHPQLSTAGHEAVDMETDGEERVVLMVKVLKGGREEKVEVESDRATVLDVKKVLAVRCGIPTYQQSLVMAGRALTDSERLCDCNIKTGTRLFLAQKSLSAPPPSAPPPSTPPSVWTHKTTQFWAQLSSFLLQHFSPADTKKIVHKMEEELRRCVYDINLDSIEAVANQILRRSQEHTPPT